MIRVRYRQGAAGETRRVVHMAWSTPGPAVRTLCGAELPVEDTEIINDGGDAVYGVHRASGARSRGVRRGHGYPTVLLSRAAVPAALGRPPTAQQGPVTSIGDEGRSRVEVASRADPAAGDAPKTPPGRAVTGYRLWLRGDLARLPGPGAERDLRAMHRVLEGLRRV